MTAATASETMKNRVTDLFLLKKSAIPTKIKTAHVGGFKN